jgi:sugar lactone lactonase YvrE
VTKAVQVTDACCEHGEGPVWSAAWPGLRWVDMLAGDLLALGPDGSCRVVLDGVTVSNGLAWSPDGGTAYYVDSATQRIDAFDYEPERGLSGRRPVVAVDPSAGTPDGLTVDADGHLWLALHGGGAVHRYRPDGRLDGRIELPVSQVTACTFGGPGLDQLYITTSRLGLDPAAEPEAGAVYQAQTGVTGQPAAVFAG